MLNVGASSPLNLHRKALKAKLNASASSSSRSVIGYRSFYSSSKSVTSADRGAIDLEGGNNHNPQSIPQNSSLVSFQTEEALSSKDGHGRDQDPPTVLGIRLASGGVYRSGRSRSRGRSSQRIAKTFVDDASDSEEGSPRFSAPSHTVCNRTFRLGDPSLNPTPGFRFAVSLTVVIEDTIRGYHKRARHDHAELERLAAYLKNVCIIRVLFCPPVGLFYRNGYVLTLVDTVKMDKLHQPRVLKSCDVSGLLGYFSPNDPAQREAGREEASRGTNRNPAFLISINSDSVSWTRHL